MNKSNKEYDRFKEVDKLKVLLLRYAKQIDGNFDKSIKYLPQIAKNIRILLTREA